MLTQEEFFPMHTFDGFLQLNHLSTLHRNISNQENLLKTTGYKDQHIMAGVWMIVSIINHGLLKSWLDDPTSDCMSCLERPLLGQPHLA